MATAIFVDKLLSNLLHIDISGLTGAATALTELTTAFGNDFGSLSQTILVPFWVLAILPWNAAIIAEIGLAEASLIRVSR